MFTRIRIADSSEPLHVVLFVHWSRCSDADVQSRKIRVIYFIRCVHTRASINHRIYSRRARPCSSSRIGTHTQSRVYVCLYPVNAKAISPLSTGFRNRRMISGNDYQLTGWLARLYVARYVLANIAHQLNPCVSK